MPNRPFAALGVPRSASVPELRSAFRRLAKKHHPDRNLGDPRAAERFKRILRAYRSALSRAMHGAVQETPVGPRPDRFECGGCGDCFPFQAPCSRCGVDLWDRTQGPAPHRESPEVRALIEELERRGEPGPTWEERLPIPGMLVAGCVVGAIFAWQVGPVGLALLLAGFGAYVTALELHRRASLSLTG